jgi:two-component system chemotaxis response regulator CheB
MDGITFLKKIMSQRPIPVIICSTLANKGSDATLRALEYGAVDIIHKPSIGTMQFVQESRILLADSVRAAAGARIRRISANYAHVEPKLSADVILDGVMSKALPATTDKVVVIGASTGGTEAVRKVLEVMPRDSPGIVVVQHMPKGFTTSFAGRLNELCSINVKEASDGDSVLRGHALIAPGNCHILLKRGGSRYYVEVRDGPLVSRHRPSVDVLFRSAARYAGPNATAAILTGMGDDGATGMKELHDAGAYTIAQDEQTSIVYGMPAVAVRLGGVDCILPLNEIATAIINSANMKFNASNDAG